MTLEKTELLGYSDCDQDRIGFVIVEMKNLDYLMVGRSIPACIWSIRSDRISAFCAGSRFFFFSGLWARRRRTAAASFLQNHHKQESHCASSLCNYHVHHIWNVQRLSFISLFVRHLSQMPRQFVVAGDVKRSAGGGSITTSWNGYSATYRTGLWHAPANNLIFSLAIVILRQLQLSDWVA